MGLKPQSNLDSYIAGFFYIVIADFTTNNLGWNLNPTPNHWL